MKKVMYIRCPRCELNYIPKKEKFCSVCKKEMQVGGGDDFDDLDLELCPICKTNYIQPDMVMCQTCYNERLNDPNFREGDDNDWEQYINRDDSDELDENQNEEIGDYASVKMLDLDDEEDEIDDEFDDDLDVISDDEKDDSFDDEFEDEFDDDDDDFDDDDDDDNDY